MPLRNDRSPSPACRLINVLCMIVSARSNLILHLYEVVERCTVYSVTHGASLDIIMYLLEIHLKKKIYVVPCQYAIEQRNYCYGCTHIGIK